MKTIGRMKYNGVEVKLTINDNAESRLSIKFDKVWQDKGHLDHAYKYHRSNLDIAKMRFRENVVKYVSIY